MPEPSQLTTVLTEFIARHGPDSRMGRLGVSLLRAHGTNQDRHAAVLKHPDLARRLTATLELARPDQWTGYIPPALAIDDDGGILRRIERNGHVIFNQLGHRSIGPVPNNSPQRMALLEISAEAWEREHNSAITQDN